MNELIAPSLILAIIVYLSQGLVGLLTLAAIATLTLIFLAIRKLIKEESGIKGEKES